MQQQGVVDLSISLGRLRLPNPILVASGTFGYAREMQAFVDFGKLGGIVPKTVTLQPRPGNAPPRTVETAAGLLNSIGLDNDGLEAFLDKHLAPLATLGAPLIVNIAGKSHAEFAQMAERLAPYAEIAALELNISCPNVTGGTDFGIDPEAAAQVVTSVRSVCPHPVIAKLTPNVTSVPVIARAVYEAGADAVSLVNTVQGLVVNWRKRKPVLGNGLGGLSGPAIKPIALRIVWQVAQVVPIPIIGVGGIQSIDDVMDFLVCGASAVQVGTANFYSPQLSTTLVDELSGTLAEAGCTCVQELIGTLAMPRSGPMAVRQLFSPEVVEETA